MRRNPSERTFLGVLARVLVVVVIVAVAGGAAWLATSDMPPPSAPVEKVIPNDHFKG